MSSAYQVPSNEPNVTMLVWYLSNLTHSNMLFSSEMACTHSAGHLKTKRHIKIKVAVLKIRLSIWNETHMMPIGMLNTLVPLLVKYLRHEWDDFLFITIRLTDCSWDFFFGGWFKPLLYIPYISEPASNYYKLQWNQPSTTLRSVSRNGFSVSISFHHSFSSILTIAGYWK